MTTRRAVCCLLAWIALVGSANAQQSSTKWEYANLTVSTALTQRRIILECPDREIISLGGRKGNENTAVADDIPDWNELVAEFYQAYAKEEVPERFKENATTTTLMNRLGEDGWELVAVTFRQSPNNSFSSSQTFHFKRAKR